MLTAAIENLLQSSPLIITIGNDLRADDGVGPYIFNECQMSNAKCQMINAGEKPENIMGQAINEKTTKIVIIDAADFNGRPGEVRLIEKENIPETTLSTHTFPLRVIAGLLEEDLKVPVCFLGIQPESLELGKGISAEVKASAKEIIEIISRSDTNI